MAKIFLSYRRQDSAGVAGRIYDRLRDHFGNDAVVMDIDSIPFRSAWIFGNTSTPRWPGVTSFSR